MLSAVPILNVAVVVVAYFVAGPFGLYAAALAAIVLLVRHVLGRRVVISPTGTNVVIVTGASSGIGKATALHLVEQGFTVFAGVRKMGDYDNLLTSFDDRDPSRQRLLPLRVDVAQDDSVSEAVAVVDQYLKEHPDALVTGLVNNAGVGCSGPGEVVPCSMYQMAFNVNVLGLIRMTQAFLPAIRAAKGRVVNMSSVAGLLSTPYLDSSTKAAVESYSQALRVEMSAHGVGVSCVNPGLTSTQFNKAAFSNYTDTWRKVPQALQDLYPRFFRAFFKRAEQSKAGTDTMRRAMPAVRVAEVVQAALTHAWPLPNYVIGSESIQVEVVRRLPAFVRETLLRTML